MKRYALLEQSIKATGITLQVNTSPRDIKNETFLLGRHAKAALTFFTSNLVTRKQWFYHFSRITDTYKIVTSTKKWKVKKIIRRTIIQVAYYLNKQGMGPMLLRSIPKQYPDISRRTHRWLAPLTADTILPKLILHRSELSPFRNRP